MVKEAKKLREAVEKYGLDVIDVEPEDLVDVMRDVDVIYEEEEDDDPTATLDPTEYSRFVNRRIYYED